MTTATIESQPKPNVFKRIWISITEFLHSLFTGWTKKEEEPKNETEKERRIRKLKEEYDNEEVEFKSQTSLNVEAEKLSGAINKFLLFEAFKFEHTGFENGLEGVRDMRIKADAKAKAAFLMEHTLSILLGKERALEQEKLHIGAGITHEETKYGQEKIFYDKLITVQRNEHRHFHKTMGAFYILMGVVMMIADFPISLSIAKYFVDEPIGFVSSFWNQLTNPEMVLFSAGITFLGIYFKVFYDEYFNHSILKKDEEVTAGQLFKFRSVTGFIFKVAVLFTVIGLLYKLGNLRNALNLVSIEPVHTGLVTKEEIYNYKLVSFVVTTVLLPLISGICLSLGFGIFSNCSNLKAVAKSMKATADDIKAKQTELVRLETIISTISSLIEDWEDNDEREENLADQFEGHYIQGFRRGHRATFGDDAYANANSLYIDALTSQFSKQ